jgi:alpha-L-rhamnosidase
MRTEETTMSQCALAIIIAAVLCVGSLCVASGADVSTTRPRLVDLQCEYLANPAGIDSLAPRLSWIMAAGQRDQAQTAYQVVVGSSAELLAADRGDLWDSGKVNSDRSINIEYAGKPLESRMVCHWKVRAWDAQGRPTPWSEPAVWSMGLLNPRDWKAEWIGLPLEITDDAFSVVNLNGAGWIWDTPTDQAGTNYFRRQFDLPDAAIKSAAIVIFGEDEFTLWVNGHEAHHGSKTLRPIAVDMAKYLTPGRNTLAVQAHIEKAKTHGGGLAARLGVTLADGRSVNLTTDGAWPVSSKEVQGWNAPSFDDSSWTRAVKSADFFVGDQTHRWIWVPAPAPAHYLRREFVASQPIRRATAYVSGMGWFELHINGQKIGDHVLDPVVSDYGKRAFYITFDVTDQIKQGPNAIGAILGLGRYCNMQLRVQVELEYADGQTAAWLSDETWKATDGGPIVSNSEYDGETYDARLEMPGWDEPGFDDSKWTQVGTEHGPGVQMSAQMVEPIRVTETIKPKALTQPRPGVFVFDLGQNMVGWCRLRVQGPAGAIVRLHHAETLKPDGMIYVANLRTAKATDEYILKGGSLEIYEPRFTYHGFRYVEVTGFPGEANLSSLEGRVVNDDLAESGEFECSDALLNQIHRNIFWGVRGNYNGVPTDCPQRNERLGWLGDRGAECTGEAYLFNIAALYQKWMGDMRDGQTAAGSISDTAPGNLNNDGVVWPSTYLLAADMLYRQYGNVRALADHYDAMKKWIDYMNGFLKDGMMPRNTYGDWCVPPESASLIHSQDPLRQTDGKLLSTTYFYHDLRLMAQWASLLDKPADAERFSAQAEAMKTAFNHEFLDEKTGQYANGSQTSSVLPLALGLVPEGMKQKVFDHLVEKIQSQNKDHLGTGLVGGQFLMRVLSDNGRSDLAYAIATQTSYPSWGYMVSKGATTIWELWNGDTADPSMNSGNHVMLVGDLNIWLQEYVVGISPDAASPGWKHFDIHPRLTGRLDWARGHYDSPYGRIACDWSRKGAEFSLNMTIPANSTATVYVPAQDASVVKSDGGKFLGFDDGYAAYHVASGSYQFTSRLAE